MIYQYTSVKEIMGRVIRDVGNKLPAHYYDSMLEWLPEGMRQLETKYQIVTKSTGNFTEGDEDLDPKALYTKNHVVPIPSDLITLLAVEDCFGNRVRSGSDITDFTNQTNRFVNGNSPGGGRPTNFQVDTEDHDPLVPWDGSDLVPNENVQVIHTYKIQGNMIQTSEECMFIKLHYKAFIQDEEGYLMVPDVEEYKSALTFYVLRQLVGAGFNHPIWNGPPGWNHFNVQWELMAGRALGVIKYPSQDNMEKLRTSFAERLIPPRHLYSDFFIGAEQTQDINQI